MRDQPSLLAHTIHESIEFNKLIKSKFEVSIPCISDYICKDSDCFDLWVQFESSRSISRLHKFLESESSWSFEVGEELAVIASSNLIDLIESTTSLCEAFETETLRYQLFEQLSLPLLNEFYEWISEKCTTNLDDSFGHLISSQSPQSIEVIENDLKAIAMYYTCLEQITNWFIFWTNDLVNYFIE